MADVHLEKTGEIVCLPGGGREERWRSVKTSSCGMGWGGGGPRDKAHPSASAEAWEKV